MNEQGLVYPITLCLLFLMSLFLSINFSQYVTEKGVMAEMNQQERRQYLFLLSSKKISEQIKKGEVQENGVITYDDIQISYAVAQTTSLQYTVNFTLQQGTLQVKASALYEGSSGILLKWFLPV